MPDTAGEQKESGSLALLRESLARYSATLYGCHRRSRAMLPTPVRGSLLAENLGPSYRSEPGRFSIPNIDHTNQSINSSEFPRKALKVGGRGSTRAVALRVWTQQVAFDVWVGKSERGVTGVPLTP